MRRRGWVDRLSGIVCYEASKCANGWQVVPFLGKLSRWGSPYGAGERSFPYGVWNCWNSSHVAANVPMPTGVAFIKLVPLINFI